MSLVNDALKRAKLSQPKNPTPAIGPAFRLAETTPASRSQDILFSTLVVVILLLGGVLLRQWSNAGGGELKVRARTFPNAYAANPASQQSLIPVQLPVPPVMIAPENTAVASEPAVTDGTVPAVAAEPLQQPNTFKLQSVLYLSGNPSAVINGKVVHVHSSVNDARVVAIAPGTVTLVTAEGHTNVLAMPEELR